MRSTDDRAFIGSTPAGAGQSRKFLSVDELALPAVCGQTSKPFLMVVRRIGHGAVELVRAVVIGPSPSIGGLPGLRADSGFQTQSRTAEDGSARPDISFQALNMKVKIQFGRLYEGCPYCRASGYFHCTDCAVFSCWDRYNSRPHLDHSDVWCAACQAWKCTPDGDEGDSSTTQLIAFACRENTVDLSSRIVPGPNAPHQVDRSTSIRAYLK